MSNRYIYHKIEQGDTMKSIAQKYGITTYAITRKNPTVTGDKSLKVGSFLVIGLLGDEESEDNKGNGGNSSAKEDKEQEDKEQSVVLPERWLSEQEIHQMALERVGNTDDALKQLAIAKDKALSNIEESAKRDALDYKNAIDALNNENKAEKNDFLQDAIQQGISRSSIVDSTNKEYDRQRDAAIYKKDQQKKLDDQERENAKGDVLTSYYLDVDEVKQKYQQKYDEAVEDIREKNQDANINMTVSSGGVKDSDSYKLTDKLLDTLSRKNASDYLERNREQLVQAWGDDAYLRLVQKYK